jgi:transcriptional regulator with PAS, ATPase and Fis domain
MYKCGGTMSKHSFKNINDYVSKLADVIGEVLRVEVEIVDRDLRTVSRSGSFKKFTHNIIESDNYIYKKVIESGKKIVIENPGFHKLCENCRKKHVCTEKFQCCTPIKLEGETIGIIALICFTEEQKKTILSKLKEYSDFLDRMAELIALKIRESDLGQQRDSTLIPCSEGVSMRVTLDSIVSESCCMKELKSRVSIVAKGTANILLIGESGCGKELFAMAIHSENRRVEAPFIAVNCGAIPETLMESELFGYAPGAFTGASKSGKVGKFELAQGGTIFLDEIGDMPQSMQVKLLRVIQDKIVIPVGSNKPIKVALRIISATNKRLEKLIEEGSFREDLYYRLNVIPFEIPPLRERKEDILPIASDLLKKYCRIYGRNLPEFDQEVRDAFIKYTWKGNVRELENTLEYVVNILGREEVVSLKHLPHRLQLEKTENLDCDELNIERLEKETIVKAIIKYGKGTEAKRKAAAALGISVASLYRKIDKYGLKL